MATVYPFKALRYPASTGVDPSARLLHASRWGELDRRGLIERDPLHPVHLFAAPDPWALLRQWWKAGGLVESDAEAYHLLELTPVDEHGTRGESARLLLAGLTPEHDPLGLEEGDAGPLHPALEPVLALASDDQQVLRRLLAQAANLRPPDLENPSVPVTLRCSRCRRWSS